MKREVRVRFAPSPTGTLHIGGIRTALYNYLFARQNGGKFILRIEDTDQTRYVPGAEEYIIEALKWSNLIPDEGVGFGGEYGPYRQSERMSIYQNYGLELVEKGAAYFAFDMPEELETRRAAEPNFTYSHHNRMELRNSLVMDKSEVDELLASGAPHVIRLKFDAGQQIHFQDAIRGEVVYQTDVLDDKVLLKADGMPTYHLANVVDDYLMKISHVIRGEEWLSSTPHHVALYKGFGWLESMPQFVHLPLILKPEGNGKLSKRDGAKFGFPVFPLAWKGDSAETSFTGFREEGFFPEAMINFLALLGWHPTDDQEIFHINELIQRFDLEQISKSGARFDYEKAKWFNQKYMSEKNNSDIAAELEPKIVEAGYDMDTASLIRIVGMMKERVSTLNEFVTTAPFLYTESFSYDDEQIRKKWNASKTEVFEQIIEYIFESYNPDAVTLEHEVKSMLSEGGHKPGEYLPLLRLGLAGTLSGPGVFDMITLFGAEGTRRRLTKSLAHFQSLV